MGARNASQTLQRHALAAARPRPGYDSSGELNEEVYPNSNLHHAELSHAELDAELARILRVNSDVLPAHHKTPTYFGTCVGPADQVMGEPGRFLHNSGKRRGKSLTTPMVQYAQQNGFGLTIFSQQEALQMKRRARLVYEPYEMYQAWQVEEHLQSTCMDIITSSSYPYHD
jgi:hypothetical protein